ncbi:hypothetical protein HUC21_02180 [Escherichia coli]|nr:hypothetical protein [Escherichia coli]
MSTNNELLIRLARGAAKAMSPSDADIVNKLCTQLDCALAAARTACGERTAAHSTLEKAREVTNCPDGVDLQDHLKQLVAENLAMKAAFDKPDGWLSWHSIPPTFYEPDRGGEYLQVHERSGEKNDDGSDSWPVYSKPEIETPATDSILREAEARGVENFANTLHVVGPHEHPYSVLAREFAKQLREGKA